MCACFAAGTAIAGTPSIAWEATLTAPDVAFLDAFGAGVDIWGDTASVGSIYHDSGASNAGAAYVFVETGGVWTLQAKLVASDPVAEAHFGIATAGFGERLVVGARHPSSAVVHPGAAYVFSRSAGVWTQEAKLVASDAHPLDLFGVSVDMEGDLIVVGAARADGSVAGCGAAYVFERVGGTWVQQAKLSASDPHSGDFFGSSVDLEGDRILVGAQLADGLAQDSGAAYAFTRNGSSWSEEAKLVASDGTTDRRFGLNASLSGARALIGDWRATSGATMCGGAYAFARSGTTWTQEARLAPPDPQNFAQFGIGTALVGTTALVGSIRVDRKGAVYAYEFDGVAWTLVAKALSSQPQSSAFFGEFMASDGERLIAGSTTFDSAPIGMSGIAEIFRVTPHPLHAIACFGDGSLATPCPCAPPNSVPSPSGGLGAGCANSFNGTGAKLRGSGELAPDALRLSIEFGANYQGFTLMVRGTSFVPSGVGLADGLRCASGALIRFGGHNAGTNGAPPGFWTYPNAVQSIPVSTASLQAAGATAYYQGVYRNPSAGFCSSGTYNYTNAVQVDWPQ